MNRAADRAMAASGEEDWAGWVCLIVSGVPFYTTQSTLLHRGRETFFAALLRSVPKTTEPFYWIDRDPHIFPYILSYLRGRHTLPDTPYTLACIRDEADFYSLTELSLMAHAKYETVRKNTIESRLHDIQRQMG